METHLKRVYGVIFGSYDVRNITSIHNRCPFSQLINLHNHTPMSPGSRKIRLDFLWRENRSKPPKFLFFFSECNKLPFLQNASSMFNLSVSNAIAHPHKINVFRVTSDLSIVKDHSHPALRHHLYFQCCFALIIKVSSILLCGRACSCMISDKYCIPNALIDHACKHNFMWGV